MIDLRIKEFEENIEKLWNQKERIVIAIEGGSAAGKTTVAKKIEEKYYCNVLHMDDFFLRPEQRTKERLEEIGGNVDRERFYEEVVLPLTKGEIIKYQPFDCQTFALGSVLEIKPDRLTVVEGAYSTHPELGKYYDLALFLDIDSELQKKRIIKRNGQKMAERFFHEWIPMERKYFEAMNVKEKCDLILTVSE